MKFTEKDLFGGAVRAQIPDSFLDVSDIRQVPDHQEVYLSRSGSTSLIIELNARLSTSDAATDRAALMYYIHDLVEMDNNQTSQNPLHVWGTSDITLPQLPENTPVLQVLASVTTEPPRLRHTAALQAPTSGQAHSTGAIIIYLLLIRLVPQETDVLIIVNVPVVGNARDVIRAYMRSELLMGQNGHAHETESEVPEIASRSDVELVIDGKDVLDTVAHTFDVRDWNLFVG